MSTNGNGPDDIPAHIGKALENIAAELATLNSVGEALDVLVVCTAGVLLNTQSALAPIATLAFARQVLSIIHTERAKPAC